MKRTKAHVSYHEPSRRDVQTRFQQIGFEKSYSHDLVHDIANAYSHVMKGGIAADSFLPITGKNSDYHKNIQSFINALDFNAFTGDTPLQKAASIVTAMASQKGGQGKEEEGEPLPFFQDSEDSMEEKAEKLEEDVENMRNVSKDASRYFFNPDFDSPELAINNMDIDQEKVLQNLAVLGDRGKIKAKRTSAKKIVRQMSEYSQITSVANMTAFGMPTFDYKFATKQLMVKIPKQSTKQLLVLLIDDSSSMDTRSKVRWIKTLLLDRVNAVAKGEAELYIACFIGNVCMDSIIKISTKKEAIDFVKSRWFPDLNGGGTDIQSVIEETCQAIHAGKLGKYNLRGENPQIVVINDGDDDVDEDYKPSIITHAFILGQDNDEMKAIIENSGGHYERFL